MRLIHRARNLLIGGALVAVLLTAVPMTAAQAVSAAPVSCAGSPEVCITGVGVGNIVGGTETVSIACTATVAAAVASTGVGCFIQANGVNSYAPNMWVPGNASATTMTFTNLLVQTYVVCAAGGYLTVGGNFVEWAQVACFPLN